VNDDAIRSLASEGVPKAKIARDLGVPRMTIYRALEKQKTEAKMNENSQASGRCRGRRPAAFGVSPRPRSWP